MTTSAPKDGASPTGVGQKNPAQQAPAQKGMVVNLTHPPAHASPGKKPQVKRRRRLLLSFVLCVALPLVAATWYYAYVATDRYAARVGFSIRGIDTSSGLDGIGALTGLANAGSTTSDSYIVLEFLESRALLEAVDQRVGLREVYSDLAIDRISRLGPDPSIEDFVKYWRRHIHTQFDPTSGIIEFEVQSFTPGHARQIAEAALATIQDLVNDLSASARQDALRFATAEVTLQETRMRTALSSIRDFRATEQSVDPSASAVLDIQLVAALEARLIDINARIAAQRATLDEDAPSLVALLRSAEALSAQIDERRTAIGSLLGEQGGSAIPERLARYENLEVERTLAEQAYASALSSLEQARRDADRQQRYLAVHLRPQIAEQAEYPHSIRNTLLLAFALISAWGIGTLITYSVRDHLT